MPQFADYLVDVISDGHVEQALQLLRSALTKYKNTHKDGDDAHTAGDLSNQVVMLSSRYQELERHESMGTISVDNAKIERSSITYSLLEIANTLSDYAHFLSFADELPQPKVAAIKPVGAKPQPTMKPPAVAAMPPAKSRTVLWVGVGAGAMLLLIIALAMSADSPASSTDDPNANIESADAAQVAGGNGTQAGAVNNRATSRQMLIAQWTGHSVEAIDQSEETLTMVQEINKMIHTITYDFHIDGTMSSYIGDKSYTGKYMLAQDDYTITISDGESTDTYHIEGINGKELILSDLPNKHVMIHFRRD